MLPKVKNLQKAVSATAEALTFELGICDHGLAERNAAVVGRDLWSAEKLRSHCARRARDRAFHQIDILKRAAAQAHAIDSFG